MPPNLHSLATSGHPLLVFCLLCQHRSAIAPEKVGARDGSMQEIRTLKLKCSTCGGKDFRAFVVPRREHVDRFVAKAPLDEFKGLEA